MKVLVTGSAGFIGSALCIRLLARGDLVIGIDNHNDYYDPSLKEARLARHANHSNYTHLRIDIADRSAMEQAFEEHKPQGVINLAAQAGVRYSIENPLSYFISVNCYNGIKSRSCDKINIFFKSYSFKFESSYFTLIKISSAPSENLLATTPLKAACI